MKKIVVLLFASANLLSRAHNFADNPYWQISNILGWYGGCTLGLVAKYSDVAGIGIVEEGLPPTPIESALDIETQPGYFNVRIEHPLVGCTNNQVIRIRHDYEIPTEKPSLDLQQTDPELYDDLWLKWYRYTGSAPTNHARIVFAAGYYYYYDDWVANWNCPYELLPEMCIDNTWIFDNPWTSIPPRDPMPENPTYKFKVNQREWWYLTDETQLQTTHFSNAIHHIRIDRNWTNYYELCRSGFTSAVERVRNDSNMDIHYLIKSANDDKLHYIRNDPLLPQDLITEGYLDYIITNSYYRVRQNFP